MSVGSDHPISEVLIPTSFDALLTVAIVARLCQDIASEQIPDLAVQPQIVILFVIIVVLLVILLAQQPLPLASLSIFALVLLASLRTR